jgi:ABC-type Mn2+/Zn2+ transport system permease subunit
MWHCMLAATLICLFCVTVGLGLSFALNLPSGPVIVVLAGAIHLLATAVSAVAGVVGRRCQAPAEEAAE